MLYLERCYSGTMRGVGTGSRNCPGKDSVPRRIRHGWDGWVDRGNAARNGGDSKGFYSKFWVTTG